MEDNSISLITILEKRDCKDIEVKGIFLGNITAECNFNDFVWQACKDYLTKGQQGAIVEEYGSHEEWEDWVADQIASTDLSGYVVWYQQDAPLNCFNGELDDCEDLAKYVNGTLAETRAEQG